MAINFQTRISHLEDNFQHQLKDPRSALHALTQTVVMLSELVHHNIDKEPFLKAMGTILHQMEEYQNDPLYQEIQEMVDRVRYAPKDLETKGLEKRVEEIRSLLLPTKFDEMRRQALSLEGMEAIFPLIEVWIDQMEALEGIFTYSPQLLSGQMEVIRDLYQQTYDKLPKHILEPIQAALGAPSHKKVATCKQQLEEIFNQLMVEHYNMCERLNQELINDEAFLAFHPD